MTRAARGRGPDPRLPRHLDEERGAATALVALFLPCLLVGVGLVIDVGALLVARSQLRAAADMGALAGVQDLDYDLLAHGQIVIREDDAVSDAQGWIGKNLDGRSFIISATIDPVVTVLNTSLQEDLHCPVTGRHLREPTVCVLLRAKASLPFWPSPGTVTVSVHADASVVGRPD